MIKKHLTLDDRKKIEDGLDIGDSFGTIATAISKHKSTISYEVRKNSSTIKPSTFNNNFNICKFRRDCICTHLCQSTCNDKCSLCKKCNDICPDFVPDTCDLLNKPPYVCNNCCSRKGCRKIKVLYKAREADEIYRSNLKSSRIGINLTEKEFEEVKNIVIPAIKKGHSPAMIVMNNPDINRSETSIYRDIQNRRYDEIGNIDLPRQVKFKKRIPKEEQEPRDTKNRENRTYDDMLQYKAAHPFAKVVQFDTVEGTKGGKCLFTIHFPTISYMLAFLIDSQKAAIIVSKMGIIKNIWKDNFYIYFEIGITDNGKEFQMPDEMEYYDGIHKMHLFYCDPGKSYQKPEIEHNHTFIRRILPKGTSFDDLTQDDINLMMNHINSVPREELGGKTPYELACETFGTEIVSHFSKEIERNKVILKPSLLKK